MLGGGIRCDTGGRRDGGGTGCEAGGRDDNGEGLGAADAADSALGSAEPSTGGCEPRPDGAAVNSSALPLTSDSTFLINVGTLTGREKKPLPSWASASSALERTAPGRPQKTTKS